MVAVDARRRLAVLQRALAVAQCQTRGRAVRVQRRRQPGQRRGAQKTDERARPRGKQRPRLEQADEEGLALTCFPEVESAGYFNGVGKPGRDRAEEELE